MDEENKVVPQEHYYIERQGRRYYTAGPDKPPIFIQAIIDDRKMSAIDFFHITDAYLDWEKKGNSWEVLEPLVALLSTWGDELIFAFDDTMAELLYTLDTREIAHSIYKDDIFSGDEFLEIRCVALVNSKSFYNAVIKGRKKLNRDLGFSIILAVPEAAWARRHGKEPSEYPHVTPYCYETRSNAEGWPETT